MLLGIRLETFAVLRGRPGLARPVLPSADVVDPALLYDPARFGENHVPDEIGDGDEEGVDGEGVDEEGVDGEGVDEEGVDEDGGIRA